jgi:hypothetical protein
LFEALDNGNESLALLFLNNGANSSISDKYGRTPLHVAAGKGYLSNIQRLLDSGDNASVEDKRGWTPLHSGAGSKSEEASVLNRPASISRLAGRLGYFPPSGWLGWLGCWSSRWVIGQLNEGGRGY